MTASEPVQAPRTAWTNGLRDEAARMDRPEISKIVHVGWVIASFGNSDGTNCHPATETIAAIVGSSDETVTRAKRVLKALGLLVEKRRPNTSSMYRIQQPVGGWRLDWDTHMHLYTDTPQARRKRRLKEQQIAEQLARREAELAAGRTPFQNGVRNPSQNRVQESRNPFPPGVPNQPEPVPAGGSDPAPDAPGTRSGRGAEPVAERGPEPVPAGGEQREEDKGPDKETAGLGSRPPASPGQGPESHISEREEEAGPALACVPAPPGRTRRPTATAAASTQPPLLLAVQEQNAPTRDDVRQVLAERGVAAALRRYGRSLVIPELAADSPHIATARHVQTELTVPCHYCDAPAGTPCRSSAGLRGLAHEGRREAWDVAYANCPTCKATAGHACTNRDGSPRHGIHPPRAGLGAQMRQIADQQTRTGT